MEVVEPISAPCKRDLGFGVEPISVPCKRDLGVWG